MRSSLVQHLASASSDIAATGATEHAGYVGEAAEYSGGVEEMSAQFVFDDKAMAELRDIARSAGVEPREALMRALGTFAWLLERVDEGYEVGAGKPGEEFRAIDVRGDAWE